MIESGTTRNVVLIGAYAIKIPKLTKLRLWPDCQYGRTPDLSKRQPENARTHLPDPVFNPRRLAIDHAENTPPDRSRQIDPVEFMEVDGIAIPGEFKASSYGMLNGKPVLVDYS